MKENSIEISSIDELPVNRVFIDAIKKLGFTELTPIQAKAIPVIMEGKDVVGQSGTGSGKTLAFGLPLLEKAQAGRGIQTLILTPTRELCVQVADTLDSFGRLKNLRVVSIYGGVSITPQFRDLQRADVVVGTPGRILDHIDRRTMNFEKIGIMILDEADKMFEMGFAEDVESIMENLPDKRQTLLFSATMPPELEKLMHKHLYHPVKIEGQKAVDIRLLRQGYYEVDARDKFSLLVHLLKNETSKLALVFCATRDEADIVAWNLGKLGVAVKAIHGGLSQSQRLRSLDALKEGKINVLVATDVAARGLDIKHVSHVYNYDVPKTAEDYTHRIGRTARAGAEGDAVTLLSPRDHDNFRRILANRSVKIESHNVPRFDRVEFIRNPHDRGGERGGRGFRDARSGGFGGGRGGSRGEGRSFGGSSSRGEGRSEGRPYGERRSEHQSFSGRSSDNKRKEEGSQERGRSGGGDWRSQGKPSRYGRGDRR